MRILRDDKKRLIIIANNSNTKFDLRACNYVIEFLVANAEMFDDAKGGFTCGQNAVLVEGADDEVYQCLVEGLTNLDRTKVSHGH